MAEKILVANGKNDRISFVDLNNDDEENSFVEIYFDRENEYYFKLLKNKLQNDGFELSNEDERRVKHHQSYFVIKLINLKYQKDESKDNPIFYDKKDRMISVRDQKGENDLIRFIELSAAEIDRRKNPPKETLTDEELINLINEKWKEINNLPFNIRIGKKEYYDLNHMVTAILNLLARLYNSTSNEETKKTAQIISGDLSHTQGKEVIEVATSYRAFAKPNSAKVRKSEYYDAIDDAIRQVKSDIYSFLK